MPLITSDTSNTHSPEPVPANRYRAVVVGSVYNPEKMRVSLTWELNGAPYNGRRIQFDDFPVGGETRAGEIMPLNALLNRITATNIPWKSQASDEYTTEAPVRKGKDYVCPMTNEIVTAVTFNSDHFVGKSADIDVTKVGRRIQNDSGEWVDSADPDEQVNKVRRAHRIA